MGVGKRITHAQLAREKEAAERAERKRLGIRKPPSRTSQVCWDEMTAAQRRAHRMWTLGGLNARLEGFVEKDVLSQDEADRVRAIFQEARQRHEAEPKETYSND